MVLIKKIWLKALALIAGLLLFIPAAQAEPLDITYCLSLVSTVVL